MSARPPITFLDRLSDVDISSPSDGQTLIFNAGLVKWQNLAVPGGELATLSDVLIGTPTDGQLLAFVGGSWINYGPLHFTDILGNIAVAQLAGGAGATASTYFRGDNSWVAPPVGTIPATTTMLLGDGGGNAIASLFQPFGGGYQVNTALAADLNLGLQNTSSLGFATLMIGTDLSSNLLKLRAWCQAVTPGMAIAAANDSAIIAEFGNLILATNSGVIKGTNNNGTSERWRFANGLSLGTTTDKGAGTVNATGGYYLNGNKVGGVATVTATVDQTAVTETAHVTFTIPGNSAVVGTVYHIHASGNVDNGTTAITYTPRIRWGGTGGTDFMGLNVVVFTASTTSATNRPFVFDARVTIRSIGGTGTAMCEYSYVETSTSATRVEASHVGNSGATATTIDTTANKDLVFTWTLSATTGTPHIRTISGHVEVIQP